MRKRDNLQISFQIPQNLFVKRQLAVKNTSDQYFSDIINKNSIIIQKIIQKSVLELNNSRVLFSDFSKLLHKCEALQTKFWTLELDLLTPSLHKDFIILCPV